MDCQLHASESYSELDSHRSMAAANAGQINHAEPGPIDNLVLTQQANHRSEAIWNRIQGPLPTVAVEHTDINDVLTAVHHIDRVQPPIPEALNEEATSPAGPSTTKGPSTSTAPTGCPSRLPTPDPSPYTPHQYPWLTIPSSTSHPSPTLTISSPIPHPSLSLTISSPIPHPSPSPIIPPPTPQEFPKLSPTPSLNLVIGPTPPYMQQEPPSHNTPTGPSSAIDPPLVEPEQAVGLPTMPEGRPKRISKAPPCGTGGHKHGHPKVRKR
ncbi:hypothetical protein CFP56_018907 [Quercus suber]|uniref:Uncharacterized protein n=1 Tax=Quercus suber TaxID=58331 RepID=A0AAW0KJB3_QUESU